MLDRGVGGIDTVGTMRFSRFLVAILGIWGFCATSASAVPIKGTTGEVVNFDIREVRPKGFVGKFGENTEYILVKWSDVDLEWLELNQPEIDEARVRAVETGKPVKLASPLDRANEAVSKMIAQWQSKKVVLRELRLDWVYAGSRTATYSDSTGYSAKARSEGEATLARERDKEFPIWTVLTSVAFASDSTSTPMYEKLLKERDAMTAVERDFKALRVQLAAMAEANPQMELKELVWLMDDAVANWSAMQSSNVVSVDVKVKLRKILKQMEEIHEKVTVAQMTAGS